MKDLLNAANRFPSFREAVNVHMVESSPSLRELQAETLTIADGPEQGGPLSGGGRVHWHDSFSDVPDGPLLVVGQEFLDALPIHQFEHTTLGWRERLVDVTAPDDASPYDFRFVLSPTMTPAVDTFLLRRQVVGSPLIDVNTMDVRVGDRIEVCPLAIASVEDVAKRIGKFRRAHFVVLL